MDEHSEEAESCLSPYRVLDLAEGGLSLCGKILGDLGADVIKIEPPEGDPGRRLGPFLGETPDLDKSLYWFSYNTSKRSVTLNLETATGREIFARLVATADFLLESFPPGYMEGIGLGYAALSGVNPRLVMTSITPFGQTGPYAHHEASDLVMWAMGGAMYLHGYPDCPVWISFPQASLNAGAEAASASMIAHWHRQLTGEGQHVDVSVQECVSDLLWNAIPFWDLERVNAPRVGHAFAFAHANVRLAWPCKDGYVSLMLLGGGSPFFVGSSRALVSWMDEDHMAPQWLKEFDWPYELDATRVTQETYDRVTEPVARFLMTRTKRELFEGALERHIALAPVNNVRDLLDSPHHQARDYWVKVPHPELSQDLVYCGPFIRLSRAPARVRCRPPLLGEHNQEVYERELGLSRDSVAALRRANAI